jgi:hypothetical protein
MLGRAAAAAALAALAAAPAAGGATKPRAVTYQGWTSQGREIVYKVAPTRAKKPTVGASKMELTVIVKCSGGETVAFALRAIDNAADPIKRSRFTTVLKSTGAPTATVKATFNKFGVARGTITASGNGRAQDGRDLGTCATESAVRWTAGPFKS